MIRDENMEKKKNFIVNTMFWGLIAVLVLLFIKYLFPIFVPFVIAFIIAAIIQMLAKRICKNSEKYRKPVSVTLCIVFYIGIAFLVVGIGSKLVQVVAGFIVAAPDIYKNDIAPMINELADILGKRFSSYDTGISQQLENTMLDVSQNMGQYISDFSMKAVKWFSGGITGIPGGIVKVVITVVATFFMAADFNKIIELFQHFIPEQKKEMASGTVGYVKNVLFIYVKSYSLLFFLTFIELAIGLTLLQIPYSVLVALAIAVFDILPVLGTGGILLPWAVIMFVIGDITLGVGILVMYLVITVIRNILEPRIVGKQIGLHPLVTLIALFVGLKLMGILGMILLPVSLAVLMNLYKNGVIFKKERV